MVKGAWEEREWGELEWITGPSGIRESQCRDGAVKRREASRGLA